MRGGGTGSSVIRSTLHVWTERLYLPGRDDALSRPTFEFLWCDQFNLGAADGLLMRRCRTSRPRKEVVAEMSKRFADEGGELTLFDSPICSRLVLGEVSPA